MAGIRPQRWQIATAQSELAQQLADSLDLHPLIAQILVNRGLDTVEGAQHFLQPEQVSLPDPIQDFPDLKICVDRLAQAIQTQAGIAICGDYDADGMTSTALLIRTLRHLKAIVSYDIPSRLTEGYGINTRMVTELHQQGVAVIITVDNGISAYEPIELARSLGMSVIVTDHHDLPTTLPPADAILNPKLIDVSSPYRGMAGVGVAYLLALTLAERMGSRLPLERPLLELLTLGTIADLAPLTGINRLWVKQGLHLLVQSQIPGIQALLAITGLNRSSSHEPLSPEAIGFGLGPRINAVGRLAQPSVVIELLTTDDPDQARHYAADCEQLNQQRQQLCTTIEQAAIHHIETEGWDIQTDRIIVILGQDWHHGVIGIVASRLLERYGAPVFIGSQDGDEIRGSARGIPEFNVFEALEFCKDLFIKYGGHPAAGGFSMESSHWPQLCQYLRTFAQSTLASDQIRPLVKVDAEAQLSMMSLKLFQQIQQLQPCGMGNAEPVFWSHQVKVLKQTLFGQDQSHLRLRLRQAPQKRSFSAIVWRGSQHYPLPTYVDVAYCLHAKDDKGDIELELEVKGIREPLSTIESTPVQPPTLFNTSVPSPIGNNTSALDLRYRAAPTINHPVTWQAVDRISSLLPTCQGTLLIYGYRRPQIAAKHTASELVIHYDRPQAGVLYSGIILWSWPPSITHLGWLLATTQPSQSALTIYSHQQAIPLISAPSLRQQLKQVLDTTHQIDLLRLGQQWWLAPSTLVAGLRSLGYTCDRFGKTTSLEDELDKLERWFTSSWESVVTALEGRSAET